MNYKEAKKQGYKYITRDRIGGECAHMLLPVNKNGYWYSKGWHYITTGGHACKSLDTVMEIDQAIKRKKPTPQPRKIKKDPERPVYIVTCKHCGKVFETNYSIRTYCSHDCAVKANNKRISEKPKPIVNCIICGKPFEKNTRSNTCSPECSYKRKLIKNAEAKQNRNSAKNRTTKH